MDVVTDELVHRQLSITDGVDLAPGEFGHNAVVGDVDAELVATATSRGVASKTTREAAASWVASNDPDVHEIAGGIPDRVDPRPRSRHDGARGRVLRELVLGPGTVVP